mmetsp:Transcript_35471/g.80040  ORF Transcript_35471/g.80040 Transcript_35471/m.80040 type:complete len:235 (-) Transcript_35471:181-885(-)
MPRGGGARRLLWGHLWRQPGRAFPGARGGPAFDALPLAHLHGAVPDHRPAQGLARAPPPPLPPERAAQLVPLPAHARAAPPIQHVRLPAQCRAAWDPWRLEHGQGLPRCAAELSRATELGRPRLRGLHRVRGHPGVHGGRPAAVRGDEDRRCGAARLRGGCRLPGARQDPGARGAGRGQGAGHGQALPHLRARRRVCRGGGCQSFRWWWWWWRRQWRLAEGGSRGGRGLPAPPA